MPEERLNIFIFPNLDFPKSVLWEVVFKKMQGSWSMTGVPSRLECGSELPNDLAGGSHRKLAALIAFLEQDKHQMRKEGQCIYY